MRHQRSLLAGCCGCASLRRQDENWNSERLAGFLELIMVISKNMKVGKCQSSSHIQMLLLNHYVADEKCRLSIWKKHSKSKDYQQTSCGRLERNRIDSSLYRVIQPELCLNARAVPDQWPLKIPPQESGAATKSIYFSL